MIELCREVHEIYTGERGEEEYERQRKRVVHGGGKRVLGSGGTSTQEEEVRTLHKQYKILLY